MIRAFNSYKFLFLLYFFNRVVRFKSESDAECAVQFCNDQILDDESGRKLHVSVNNSLEPVFVNVTREPKFRKMLFG